MLDGTAQAVNYNNGLSYIITPEGEDFVESLNSEYANEYRRNAQAVIHTTAGKTERALIASIYKMSSEKFHEEVSQ